MLPFILVIYPIYASTNKEDLNNWQKIPAIQINTRPIINWGIFFFHLFLN